MGAVFFSAFLLGLYLTRWMIPYLKRVGFLDQIHKEYCEKLEQLHQGKEHVPTGGGVVFLISLPIMILLWMSWNQVVTWLFVLLSCSLGLLGWFDDRIKIKKQKGHGVTAKQKFCFQVVIALCIVIALFAFCLPPQERFSLSIPFTTSVSLAGSLWGKAFCILLATVTIVGTSNAVNLTDGLDGLATGTVGVACIACMGIAYLSNGLSLSRDVMIIATSLLGLCLSFFWYNSSPAQVFMGDTGSLLLGGVLGLCFVCLRSELLLLIIGGIFVAEAGSVILQVFSCKIRKRRIFLCSPLHHHYEYKGLSESKVVSRFWIISILCAILGLLASHSVFFLIGH